MLFIYLDFSAFQGLGLGFLFDAVKIKDIQVQVSGHGADISATGCHGDFLQGFFIESGQHQVAVFILFKSTLVTHRRV